MSPEQSWLALIPKEPIHHSRGIDRPHGCDRRNIEADDTEYHGIPITHNVPVLDSASASQHPMLKYSM